MTEAEFQQNVLDLCKWLRLRVYHTHDSRRSNPGYPDLTIVGPGGVVFAELKTAKGRVSPAQREWLAALEVAGQRVFLWRPGDMPEVARVLKGLAHKKVTT